MAKAKIMNMDECGHGLVSMHRIKTMHKTLFLCKECFRELMEKIADKEFLSDMTEANAPLGRRMMIRKERAQLYAEGQSQGVSA